MLLGELMTSRGPILTIIFCLTIVCKSFSVQLPTVNLSQQKDTIPSLISSETESEIRKVNELYNLARVYFYSKEIEKGLKTTQKALLLSDSIDYKEYKAPYYLAIAAFFGDELSGLRFYYEKKAEQVSSNDLSLSKSHVQSQKEQIGRDVSNKQLISELNNNVTLFDEVKHGELRAAIFCKLGFYNLESRELDQALTFFNQSAQLYKSKGEFFPEFLCQGLKMSILHILEMPDLVKEIEQKLKSVLFKKSEDPSYGLLSKAMASSYARQGHFIKSIEYYLKSIESFAQSRELTMLPDLYRDLGIAYENLYLFEKSAESFKNCIEVLNQIGAYNKLSELYIYKVFPLIELEKYEEAQRYIELAQRDTVFVKTRFHYARLEDARGQILMKQRKYLEAISYFNRALNDFKSIEETHWGIPYVLLNISACYGHLGQTEKALKFALDSKGMIYEGQLKLARRTNQLISKLYETKGDFSPALRYLKEYENIVESSNKDGDLKILADAEIQAILERSNREIFALEREQQLAEQINTTQRLWLTVIFGALLFTILISYVLYRNFRIKTNTNARLLREKDKVEQTLEKLKDTQEQLVQQEKLASLGQLTAGIAHEIKNPLNFITNYSELGKEILDDLVIALQNNDENEIKEVVSDLDKSLDIINKNGKRADLIVKGMLQLSRSGTVEKTPTDINELSKEYLQLAYHAHKAINQGLRVDVETDLDAELGVKVINAQDIGRVILNLITNSLFAVGERQKQSNDGFIPMVKLITKSGSEMYTITVQDNGAGIPEDIKDKIFEPFFTTKKGTDGTGLGLSLSYDIVKAHNGKIEVRSDSNGTLVSIMLPV